MLGFYSSFHPSATPFLPSKIALFESLGLKKAYSFEIPIFGSKYNERLEIKDYEMIGQSMLSSMAIFIAAKFKVTEK